MASDEGGVLVCPYCLESYDHAPNCRLNLGCDSCGKIASYGCVCSRCVRERQVGDAQEGFYVCLSPDCRTKVDERHRKLRERETKWMPEVPVRPEDVVTERTLHTVSGTAEDPPAPALTPADDHIRPKHYGGPDDPYEPLKVMLAQHGKDAVVSFCWLTAEKYLARAGKKPGESIERDFRKAAFYLTHAAELLEKP